MFLSSDSKTSMKNLVDLTRPASATFKGDPFMPVRLLRNFLKTSSLIRFLLDLSESRGPFSSHNSHDDFIHVHASVSGRIDES